MAAKHYFEINPSNLIVSLKDASNVVLKTFTFNLDWESTSALPDESVNYARNTTLYGISISRTPTTDKKLQINIRENINNADSEYTQTAITITSNTTTPTNWDIDVSCKYNKKTGNIAKQANMFLENLTTVATNDTEITLDYATLIASNVNMFVIS